MKIDIIDNALPANVMEAVDDTQPLPADLLKQMADTPDIWDEPSLRGLVNELLGEREWLDIRGYTRPEFFFSDEQRVSGAEGGMVLLDWDTGMDGVTALQKTLSSRPNDGVFIITGFDNSSGVSEKVVQHFAESARRIAIYRKGDGSFSLFRMVAKFYEMIEAGVIVGRGILTNIESPQERPPDAGLVCVLYGTNRQLGTEDPVEYTSKRDRVLRYGRAYVRVAPGAPVSYRWPIAKALGIGARRSEFSHAEAMPGADFYGLLNSRINTGGKGASEFLLFVHGFAVTFKGAIEIIAQIGFDIRFPGQVGAFSWPSLGVQSKHGYMTDKDTAFACADALESFLRELASQKSISRIHIVAHSMGNFVILNTLDRLLRTSSPIIGRIGEMVLVAADVEAGWFQERRFAGLTQRTTIYSSNNDWALMLACGYQENHRLGLIPPVTCGRDCDTLDASICKTQFFGAGHDYYAESSRLLADFTLVLQGHPVDRRPALEPRMVEDSRYWELQQVR